MPDGIEAASERIGIVLADDHPLIRSGLRRVLEREAGVTVLGEAGDVEGALALARAHQPRIVVLDLNMPGEPTLTAIPQFLDAVPGSAILVLTMEAEPGFARQAITAGARGYVLKERAEAELVEAVRTILAGRTYLDPTLGASWHGQYPCSRALAWIVTIRGSRSDRTSLGTGSTGSWAGAEWASSSVPPTTCWTERWR